MSIGGGKGADDPLLFPFIEAVKEGVMCEFDVVEVFCVVAPVAILLQMGAFSDSFGLGMLSSQDKFQDYVDRLSPKLIIFPFLRRAALGSLLLGQPLFSPLSKAPVTKSKMFFL